MPRYGLGIDTGGTYTDCAVIDLDSGMMVCDSKSLTTRNDLSAGIGKSIGGLKKDILAQVVLTSLSSTLATNSVVENKGCRVGMICIGGGYSMQAQPDFFERVEGRFSMSGKEEIPLDIDAVESALENMKGRIDALAIAGYVSVRNPSHEDRVAGMARDILGVPTVCAHEFTSELGFEQRATTAVMNARLIPVIGELIDSVRKVLKELEVDSTLMIVKGDGTVMSGDNALLRPVETILSGPASSLTGARALTGIDNAMVIDMGGTTSDIGILRNGLPRIKVEGACLGGKRTRVKAADISTFGIGGDSRILVNGKETLLSPVRSVPLCMATAEWPEILEILKGIENLTDDRSAESCDTAEIIQDTEFFMLAHNHDVSELEKHDRQFLEVLRKGPARLTDIGKLLGVPPHSFSISELESRGYVIRIGVTPTDILRSEGSYSEYNGRASEIAVGYLARKCGKTPGQFIKDTKTQIINRIASCAMEKALADESADGSVTDFDRELIKRTLEGGRNAYALGFTLNMPIIGMGAPATAWLPEIARILHTELILPDHPEIGNAIGAITGCVSETVSVTVRASGENITEDPKCDVFTGKEIVRFEHVSDAMNFARKESERLVRASAAASGSKNPVIDISEEITEYELSPDKKYFRRAVVTAKATGKPELD